MNELLVINSHCAPRIFILFLLSKIYVFTCAYFFVDSKKHEGWRARSLQANSKSWVETLANWVSLYIAYTHFSDVHCWWKKKRIVLNNRATLCSFFKKANPGFCFLLYYKSFARENIGSCRWIFMKYLCWKERACRLSCEAIMSGRVSDVVLSTCK